jgi:hypothetical protein
MNTDPQAKGCTRALRDVCWGLGGFVDDACAAIQQLPVLCCFTDQEPPSFDNSRELRVPLSSVCVADVIDGNAALGVSLLLHTGAQTAAVRLCMLRVHCDSCRVIAMHRSTFCSCVCVRRRLQNDFGNSNAAVRAAASLLLQRWRRAFFCRG